MTIDRHPIRGRVYRMDRLPNGKAVWAYEARVGNAITLRGARFHSGGWPDGTNPRLCRDCRLARGRDCRNCQHERRGA